MVARGDTPHAGSYYREQNTRLHYYVDYPYNTRVENITYYPDVEFEIKGQDKYFPSYQAERANLYIGLKKMEQRRIKRKALGVKLSLHRRLCK